MDNSERRPGGVNSEQREQRFIEFSNLAEKVILPKLKELQDDENKSSAEKLVLIAPLLEELQKVIKLMKQIVNDGYPESDKKKIKEFESVSFVYVEYLKMIQANQEKTRSLILSG